MKITSIVIACVAAIVPNASVNATKISRRRTLKNNNDEKKNERTVDDRLKHTNNLRTSRVSHLRMLESSISMPSIEEAEFSMPSIEEAEMSVSIQIEEAEFSMPAVEVEPPTFPPVPFLVPLGWSNDGLGLEEEEPDMSMSVPIAEFSMPARRRLTESMPLVEADFSMPEEVDEGPKSKSRKLRRKEKFVRRFLEEGSVPLEAAEFQGPEGPIFGGKTRKLAAR